MATEHEDDEHRINGQDEELRMLYQMSAGEIDSFKQRQWQITNYAALIYAALFVALQNIDIEGNSGYLLWGAFIGWICRQPGCRLSMLQSIRKP